MKTIILLIFSLTLFPQTSFALTGDTINIYSHFKTKVITEPSKGFNSYKSTVLFPSEDFRFRKAILKITYQCPDSQRCGEWDYIDYIYLKKLNVSNNTDTSRIEIARMISPYGSRFTPDWKFEWKTDITDFSFQLHDSSEIEFIHTGYESNTDRGWLVTIKFELTVGPPVMETAGFEKLWEGIFPYGDSNDDIENYLKPVTFGNRFGADMVRLRILQTGHGMDDFENCAEFCDKYREIYFDNELKERKKIWRECGDNPLYPQAGTWIFDRAGWCPGAMVNPEVYDFSVNDSGEHILDIDMEKYVNPNKPSANYVFSSYLFYYKKPELAHDLSIVELISPNDEDIYSRNNPVCMNGKILIKNNGYDTANNILISYGFETDDQQTKLYLSPVKPGESFYSDLPDLNTGSKKKINNFTVSIKETDTEDEYPSDNIISTEIKTPPVWDPDFKVLFHTNKNPSGTVYSIKSSYGKEFEIIKPGELKPDTLYQFNYDNLLPGCYEFTITDTADNGLDFWFTPEDGYGYIRVVDKKGKLIKSFNSDFGKEIKYQFTVTGKPGIKEDITPILNIFPVRNPGKFFCDIFLNEKQNIKIDITTEDKKKTVFTKRLKNFKADFVDIDISKVQDGLYYVNVVTEKNTVTKKIKVKRD
jgi:hypothetical protein